MSGRHRIIIIYHRVASSVHNFLFIFPLFRCVYVSNQSLYHADVNICIEIVVCMWLRAFFLFRLAFDSLTLSDFSSPFVCIFFFFFDRFSFFIHKHNEEKIMKTRIFRSRFIRRLLLLATADVITNTNKES